MNLSKGIPLTLRIRLAIGRLMWRLVMPGYQEAILLIPGVPGYQQYSADRGRVIRGIETQLGINATDVFLFNTGGQPADKPGA